MSARTPGNVVRHIRVRNALLCPKVSAGLVVFGRRNDGVVCVLAVKPRVTHAFHDFLLGRHSAERARELAPEFTAEEAALLCLGNHSYALAYAQLQPPGKRRFLRGEEVYAEFLRGGGRAALAAGPHAVLEWGLPRGRQQPGEGLYETALREFSEETGLSPLWLQHTDCVAVDDYQSETGRYQVHYYCAAVPPRAGGLPEPRLASLDQLREVAAAEWRPAGGEFEARQGAVVQRFRNYVKKHKLV